MPSPAAALAALKDGRRPGPRPGDRPRSRKLDSGLSLEWPGPRELASVFALPLLRKTREFYRLGSALQARPVDDARPPEPLALPRVVEELRAAICALPALGTTESGRPYRDLRLLASEAPGALDAYLWEVAVEVRRLSPVWKPPTKAPAPRPPAVPTAARVASHRQKVLDEKRASAVWWITKALHEGQLAPGVVVSAGDLWALAEDELDELDGAEDDEGAMTRLPGRTLFYSVADELLGARRREAHGTRNVYTIPDTATAQEATVNDPTLYEHIVDRAVELVADRVFADYQERARSGDTVGALVEQRTQRDELAARRATRAA